MSKFFVLLKKELRELVTVQTLFGILVSVLIFIFLGNMMSNVTKDEAKNMSNIAVNNQDTSPMSETAINALKESGFTVILLEGQDDESLMKQAQENDLKAYIQIPADFGSKIESGTAPECRLVSKLTTLSMMGQASSSVNGTAFELMNDAVSDMLMSQAGGQMDTRFLKNPITQKDVTLVGSQQADVSTQVLQSFSMQQTMFIPIIVFLLITYATQMTVSTIASEKGDKTLETLLSAPVSRLAVLSSKMCAAGFLSLMMAGVYMIGFSQYMGGMMGGSSGGEAESQISTALKTLGLSLAGFDYVLLGIQLFLTILIALAISVVLGALAKDVKAAQGLVTPIMFLAMVPYFVTLFTDVSQLPTFAQVLLYLIPFTHTFTASSNIIFHNDLIFYGGMIYQIVLLCIVMAIAVKIFSTDKIFTMTINLGGKKNKKKAAAAE